MRDCIGLFFVLCLIAGGGVLLYEGVLNPGVSQAAVILGGATLLSLGTFALPPVMRDWKEWWEWRKRIRKFESK
jgi:hypothetical protein